MTMKRMAIDSNLLLLLIAGATSKRLLAQHKRLRAYTASDFDLLVEFIAESKLIVTPNVLTEVSNLAVYGLHGEWRSNIAHMLSYYVRELIHEEYHESRHVVADHDFIRLGLTDSAWLCLLPPKSLFLTDDLDLYLAALNRNIDACNFTHMREKAGLL